MASETLDIIIKARNDAAKALDSTYGALDDLREVAADVATGLGIALGARGVWQLGHIDAAARRLETSFRNLAGSGADKMLERLRAASRGTISDTELILSANRAMMLGVTNNAEEMARLLEVAAIRGQAMGLSTQQAFSDLMTGIGRASPLILDNLGIVTGGQAVYDNYARSIGKATSALTDYDKKRALVEMVLEQSKGKQFVPDDAASWERMNVALENLRPVLGALVNETLRLPDAINGLAQAVDNFNEAVDRGTGRQAQVVAFSAAYQQALRELFDQGKLNLAQYTAQRAAQEALEKVAWSGAMSFNTYADELRKINRAAWEAGREIWMAEGRTRAQADAARDGVGANNALAGALDGVADAAARAAEELAKAQTGSWQDWMWDYASEIDAGMMVGDVSLADRLRAREEAKVLAAENWAEGRATGSFLEARYGAKSGGGGGISEAEQQAREWANRVKGALDSVFAPSQVSEQDWWETHLGLYEDKPDEYLRRLRSAISEADSEWKHLLGGRTGEEAQLFVAQQEELWRTGQWSLMGPDFDPTASREAMVQAALAKLQAEASREAMIAEIMSDPRLGGFSTAQRERVLGTGSEAGGATYAEAWVTGAVSVDAGKEFTDAFGQQMRAQEASWRVFGGLSAGWMIEGMGDAAGQAANALIDVLFPGIMDELRRAGVVATP